MAQRNLPCVDKIGLKVGVLTDVVPEALLFNFEAITKETPLADSELEIEHIPLEAGCRKCDHRFEVVDLAFACPRCRSGQVEVIRGEELDIAYLEVPDDGDEGNVD
ncbi:hydrogenase maturation nickel metallochaperone HypA [bacterium]|nr:hydrogenase maturation nickel metallochaperone HypA [bacterium]